MRLTYGYLYLTILTQRNHDYLDGPDVLAAKPSYTKALFSGLFACTALHFLHLSEARFILQNRLPNFQTYPSIFNVVKDSLTSSS